MRQELCILGAVALVWALLAAVYALAPGLGMPGYARVWGAGALVFALLAALLAARRRTGAPPDEAHGPGGRRPAARG